MSFQCAIVTPSDSVLDSKATYVSFEAFDGQRGVADNAGAFLVKLGVGLARIDIEGGAPRHFVLDGGFAQMDGARLTLLTERALEAGTLDAAAAQRELSEANAAALVSGGPPLTLEQRAGLERRQRLARAKIAAAERGA